MSVFILCTAPPNLITYISHSGHAAIRSMYLRLINARCPPEIVSISTACFTLFSRWYADRGLENLHFPPPSLEVDSSHFFFFFLPVNDVFFYTGVSCCFFFFSDQSSAFVAGQSSPSESFVLKHKVKDDPKRIPLTQFDGRRTTL